MKHIKERIVRGYRERCSRLFAYYHYHEAAAYFLLGVMLLSGGLVGLSQAQGPGPIGSFTEAQYDDTLIRNAVGNLFKMVEGAFGALIMVVSGLGAIIASAMGAYRAAVGMLVVAVGSFILRSLVSLFFGSDYQDYEA